MYQTGKTGILSSIYTCVFITVFILSTNVHASERGHMEFIYQNVHFGFCYNSHYGRHEIRALYYKGTAAALNDYLEKRDHKKELMKKPFYITAGCYMGGVPRLSIDKNKYHNLIEIEGATNLKYLIKIAEYFFTKNWKSFYDDPRLDWSLREKQLQSFNKLLNREVGEVDLCFINKRRYKVFNLDLLEIFFENQELKVYLNKNELNISLKPPLPTKLGNRYFIVSDDSIVVYENNIRINKKKTPNVDDYINISFKKSKGRLDLCQYEQPILSYSYEKNKFYTMQQ